MKHAGIVDVDFNQLVRVRLHDGFGANRAIGPSKLVEYRPSENHRMSMLPVVCGADDGRVRRRECVDERPDRRGNDKRQIDWRDQQRAHAWMVCGVQAGDDRRQLALVCMRVHDESERRAQPLHFGAQRIVVAAADDDRIGNATFQQRSCDPVNECRAIGANAQKRLWLTHSCREAGREDDSGNHTVGILLTSQRRHFAHVPRDSVAERLIESTDMAKGEFTLRCQRCGSAMDLRDPAPGDAWKPDQFWVCPRCGRHFWTTYTSPPKPPEPPELAISAEVA